MIRTYNNTFVLVLLALNFYILSRLSFVLNENKVLASAISILIVLLLSYLLWDKLPFSKKAISNKELTLQQSATVVTQHSKLYKLIQIILVIFTCVFGFLAYYNNV